MSNRPPLKIMLSVWKALLLREGTFRLFGTRTGWVWLIVEPLAHFAFLTFLFAVIRQRTIGGIDTSIWLILGLFGFFTFRRTANQVGGAIDSNRALFAYRQVLPFDAMVARAVLEGAIMLFALMVVIGIMMLSGKDVVPDHPLHLLGALFGLWLLGGGLGLIVGALASVVDETRQILNVLMTPLYFVSGVLIPASAIPAQYRDLVLINPIFHGIEEARGGFSSYYHSTPDISLAYLHIWGICSLALGLLLYRRYEKFLAVE